MAGINKIIKQALFWLFIVFIGYIIFELTRKILGGCLGFEELTIALLITNIGFSWYLVNKISKIDSKLNSHFGWHKGKDEK